MTLAQAQTTVNAGIGAGYGVQAVQLAPNNWIVIVTPGEDGSPLDIGIISSFATANGITGTVLQVKLT